MKQGILSYTRILLWTVCLLYTGGTALHAGDSIPDINHPPVTGAIAVQAANDTIAQQAADTIGMRLNEPLALPADSIAVEGQLTAADSALFYAGDSLPAVFTDSDLAAIQKETEKNIAVKDATAFKPNPKKAYLMAAIFPGVGQIYNRQYWKLPLVYGGLVGFMYAITWNNKNYQDYQQAYYDIVMDYHNDPQAEHPENWSQSWQDFLSSTADKAGYLRDTGFHSRLKSSKDIYRRYRDLSIILSVAFYLICVADAYVDAQMFDFNITPDLSFHVTPAIYPASLRNNRSVGLNICMTF